MSIQYILAYFENYVCHSFNLNWSKAKLQQNICLWSPRESSAKLKLLLKLQNGWKAAILLHTDCEYNLFKWIGKFNGPCPVCLPILVLATQLGLELVQPSWHGSINAKEQSSESRPSQTKRNVSTALNCAWMNCGELLKAPSFTHVATLTPSGQTHISNPETTRGQHNQ